MKPSRVEFVLFFSTRTVEALQCSPMLEFIRCRSTIGPRASDSDVITPPIPFPGLPTHPVSTDSQLVLGDVTKVSIRFGYTSQ